MTIRAILFDLDDTLLWDERSVDEAFVATCEAAAQKYPEIDPLELEKSVKEQARKLYASYDTFSFTKMIGINPFEGLWGRFTGGRLPMFRKMEAIAPIYRREAWIRGLKALQIDDYELGVELGERFPEERRARSYVYEETYSVLEQLKEQFSLLLLTNGAPDLQNEKLAGVPQLVAYFDHIVISGDVGVGKPAKAIFEHAMSLLNISPEEGLMVGDKLTTDILGSNGIGMPNAWINRHGIERDDEITPRYEIQHLQELHRIIQSLNDK